LPFPVSLLTVFILVLFSGICLLGIQGSSRVSLTILTFHVLTMFVIAIMAIIRWAKMGSDTLRENWTAAQPGSANGVAQQIFFGVVLGFLGNTGFELTPSYVQEVKPGVFPKILLNLWLGSLFQLSTMMLLVWAVVPYATIQANLSNIMSVLAEEAAQAKWLRIWLVCDAVLVLCAGTSPPSNVKSGVNLW
jgi:amino acid transporter